jgi:hypothetical protein
LFGGLTHPRFADQVYVRSGIDAQQRDFSPKRMTNAAANSKASSSDKIL